MSSTIGQQLKAAREAKYLTLEKAADETRIRRTFLQALETDDYSVMPSAAQGRGFLRNYAAYLEINIDEVIAELQRDPPAFPDVSGPLPAVNFVESEPPPLTADADEPESESWTRRLIAFWTSITSRKNADAAPQKDSAAQAAAVTETEAEAESMPVEMPADEVRPEKINPLRALLSSIRIRIQRPAVETIPGVEESAVEVRAAPSETPEVIFAEVGRKLRERREMLSLNLEEVERHTRMRGAYIRALEEGAFDRLPSPVQTRGLLANYAAFLDLDTDAILLRFADAIQARHRQKYSETPRERIQTEVVTSMPILRSFIAGDLIFGVVMVAIIFALAVWGVARVINSSASPKVQATAPSIVQVLAGTVVPTASLNVTYVPLNDVPLATAVLPSPGVGTVAVSANVTVQVFAVERSFLRVTVDGKVKFDGRIAPQEIQIYQADKQIEILTGNAAALRIQFNGRDLGLLGDVGEVISRVYTITGVVTPTSTVPPSPTATPLKTSTPTPTSKPTATIASSPTP